MKRPMTGGVRSAACWLLVVVALLLVAVDARPQTDPLPSWNDGAAKQAILAFVKTTTDPASPQFVPPAARPG